MANIRQYIGARYVIKIYENSQDPSSAEWEQGNFEPLIMVTWQNGSYLSKKEVPSSVGNPALNPDYWVQTGFYNGQIASLQQQINTINNTTIPGVVNESAINVKNPEPSTGLVGAVGDGVTDDTAAVDAIMQYALTHDRNVYFPSGEYLISSITITFTEDHKTINIYGDGKRSVIKCSGNGLTLMNTSEDTIPNYSKVSNLYFYGMDITNSKLLNFVNVYNGYIENCLFERGLYGLSLVSNIWVNVLNCRFNWAGQDGVYMCGNSEDNRALYIGNNAVNFFGCVAQMNGHSGFRSIGSSGCNFYGCTAEANTACGIQIEKSGGFNGRGILISGGWFEYNKAGHIYIDERNGATDVNHEIDSCGFVNDDTMTASSGIVLIGTNSAVIIQGCHFRRISGTAVAMNYSDNILCKHNRFSYTPDYNELRGQNGDKTYVRFDATGNVLDKSRDVTSVTMTSAGVFDVNISHALVCAYSSSESQSAVTCTYINNKADGTCTVTINMLDTYNATMTHVSTSGNMLGF